MKKYGISIFVLLSCLLLVAGCSFSDGEMEHRGNLESFLYRFNLYSSGETEYRVEKENGKVFFYATGPEVSVECQVDERVLDELDARIRDYYLTQWDGFQEADSEILGGDSFFLEAEYDSGYRIDAAGYEKYPKDFEEVHAAITEYFNDMVEQINGEAQPEPLF